jgi:hypothetical protein
METEEAMRCAIMFNAMAEDFEDLPEQYQKKILSGHYSENVPMNEAQVEYNNKLMAFAERNRMQAFFDMWDIDFSALIQMSIYKDYIKDDMIRDGLKSKIPENWWEEE